MTGLDVYNDKIIEIAVIITDDNLENELYGPELIINQPHSIMNAMNPWCIDHHGQSGLTKKVLESKISTLEAQDQVLEFIKAHIPEKGVGLLCGNSIHMDKEFLRKEMPLVLEHLHYRLIDVSTVKELLKRWNPEYISRAPRKIESHRALDDIKESITELKYYKSILFRPL